MELEQRVKTLEYEIKILKNEIQRTLLDVQEQVLIHYYPTLRSEELATPEGIVQAFDGVRTKQANLANPAAAPTSSAPAVKKVTLDQVKVAHSESAAAPQGADASTSLVKLVEWAVQGSAHIGSGRTSKLIQVCGSKGILTAETKDVLTRIALLNKDNSKQASVNEILEELLKLDKTLGRPPDPEEALSLIEEAGLG